MAEQSRYSKLAIILHWLIAGLMVINIALVLPVDLLPDSWTRPIIDTHKSIGITVLGLGLMRLLWRISHRPPSLPLDYKRWERISAHLVHGLLYALILALPLSGWMHDSAWKDAATHPMKLFGLVPWPRIEWITAIDPVYKEHLHGLFGAWHTALGYMLYALFALHVGAALKHQLIDRHAELQRMGLGKSKS